MKKILISNISGSEDTSSDYRQNKKWNMKKIRLQLLAGGLCIVLLAWPVPIPTSGQPADNKAPGQAEGNLGTLSLYAENPGYLQYKGKPVILITSAEHYGAVINLDFDYNTYLETLQEEGFNYTRVFTGTYLEPADNIFGIRRNTLAPLPGRYMSPWIQENGKYDLDRFNPAYFERLKDFLGEAQKRGIMVEVTLFSSIYHESAWKLCPFYPANNLKGEGPEDLRKVNTPGNGSLKIYQEEFIRKIVREINEFGNVFFEIQNEPWSDNGRLAGHIDSPDEKRTVPAWQREVTVATEASLEWQNRVAELIMEEEENLPLKHLINQNISNFFCELDQVPAGISMINFHYARPEAALRNLDLGVVIGLDETGFMPHNDTLYLDQAWRFLLSGGGLYNNLDYSFVCGSEQGDFPIPASNPGWGGPAFRKKLSVITEAMNIIPFWEMTPDTILFKTEHHDLVQHSLKKEGEVYLAFLEYKGTGRVVPKVPESEYHVTLIDPDSGEKSSRTMKLGGGNPLLLPDGQTRIAVLIQKSQPNP
jgi:hypothetical protein